MKEEAEKSKGKAEEVHARRERKTQVFSLRSDAELIKIVKDGSDQEDRRVALNILKERKEALG